MLTNAATEAELDAGMRRRQCPPLSAGTNLSLAFLHVPKTAGNFLQNIARRALPEEGSGRYCVKRRDYSEFANDPCNRLRKPGHLQLLADLRANFTHVCSGFNVHQDYGFFQALGVDHARTLTMVALRHPVERALSHYYFQMAMMRDNPKGFLFWPKNDSDYSGLIAFASRQRRQANYHTYMLAGALGCQWPGGPVPPTSDAAILERAKRNLERFCVILITVRWLAQQARVACGSLARAAEVRCIHACRSTWTSRCSCLARQQAGPTRRCLTHSKARRQTRRRAPRCRWR